jgi:hypothetical protein
LDVKLNSSDTVARVRQYRAASRKMAVDQGPFVLNAPLTSALKKTHIRFENSGYRSKGRIVQLRLARPSSERPLTRDKVVSLYWFAYRPSMAVPSR